MYRLWIDNMCFCPHRNCCKGNLMQSCKGQATRAETFWGLSPILANVCTSKIEKFMMLWKSQGWAQGLCWIYEWETEVGKGQMLCFPIICVNQPHCGGQHVWCLLSNVCVCSRRGKSKQEGGVAYMWRQKTARRRELEMARLEKASSLGSEGASHLKTESHWTQVEGTGKN